MTWPGSTTKRSVFRCVTSEFQFRLDLEDTIAFSACPGENRCHGCMSWCDECGDVGDVCNAIRCDRHRCRRCHDIVPSNDRDGDYNLCKECEYVEQKDALDEAIDAAFPVLRNRSRD